MIEFDLEALDSVLNTFVPPEAFARSSKGQRSPAMGSGKRPTAAPPTDSDSVSPQQRPSVGSQKSGSSSAGKSASPPHRRGPSTVIAAPSPALASSLPLPAMPKPLTGRPTNTTSTPGSKVRMVPAKVKGHSSAPELEAAPEPNAWGPLSATDQPHHRSVSSVSRASASSAVPQPHSQPAAAGPRDSKSRSAERDGPKPVDTHTAKQKQATAGADQQPPEAKSAKTVSVAERREKERRQRQAEVDSLLNAEPLKDLDDSFAKDIAFFNSNPSATTSTSNASGVRKAAAAPAPTRRQPVLHEPITLSPQPAVIRPASSRNPPPATAEEPQESPPLVPPPVLTAAEKRAIAQQRIAALAEEPLPPVVPHSRLPDADTVVVATRPAHSRVAATGGPDIVHPQATAPTSARAPDRELSSSPPRNPSATSGTSGSMSPEQVVAAIFQPGSGNQNGDRAAHRPQLQELVRTTDPRTLQNVTELLRQQAKSQRALLEEDDLEQHATASGLVQPPQASATAVDGRGPATSSSSSSALPTDSNSNSRRNQQPLHTAANHSLLGDQSRNMDPQQHHAARGVDSTLNSSTISNSMDARRSSRSASKRLIARYMKKQLMAEAQAAREASQGPTVRSEADEGRELSREPIPRRSLSNMPSNEIPTVPRTVSASSAVNAPPPSQAVRPTASTGPSPVEEATAQLNRVPTGRHSHLLVQAFHRSTELHRSRAQASGSSSEGYGSSPAVSRPAPPALFAALCTPAELPVLAQLPYQVLIITDALLSASGGKNASTSADRTVNSLAACIAAFSAVQGRVTLLACALEGFLMEVRLPQRGLLPRLVLCYMGEPSSAVSLLRRDVVVLAPEHSMGRRAPPPLQLLRVAAWCDMHRPLFHSLRGAVLWLSSDRLAAHQTAREGRVGFPPEEEGAVEDQDGGVTYYTDLIDGHPLAEGLPLLRVSDGSMTIPPFLWRDLRIRGKFSGGAAGAEPLLRLQLTTYRPRFHAWQSPSMAHTRGMQSGGGIRVVLARCDVRSALSFLDAVFVDSSHALARGAQRPLSQQVRVVADGTLHRGSAQGGGWPPAIPALYSGSMLEVLRQAADQQLRTVGTCLLMGATSGSKPLGLSFTGAAGGEGGDSTADDEWMDIISRWAYPFPSTVVVFYAEEGRFEADSFLSHFVMVPSLEAALQPSSPAPPPPPVAAPALDPRYAQPSAHFGMMAYNGSAQPWEQQRPHRNHQTAQHQPPLAHHHQYQQQQQQYHHHYPTASPATAAYLSRPLRVPPPSAYLDPYLQYPPPPPGSSSEGYTTNIDRPLPLPTIYSGYY